ncbi:MAG: winged helix-turn-helix domain-containing protein [Acidobacteriota bacterium]|nr:winged helix-turn-helix domain-containing protein [Acidobacteriota bacterium]
MARSFETVPRYHFNEFVLSPRRRLLLRGGSEQPLIPRYFDLLVFLVEHRHEAVHRRDIFDRVWRDVTVSDSALSQAIRTIRRVLDDDPRDPRFIRTVSRHGYRFVFTDVREEHEDDGAWPPVLSELAAADAGAASGLLTARQSVAAATAPSVIQPERREARDHFVSRPANARAHGWTGAASGGATAGIVAGGLGGLILAAAPDSSAPLAIAPVLAVIGGGCGALGGTGVGAGLALAEPLARSQRVLKLTIAAALGGGLVGLVVQWLTRWALSALVGLNVAIGGSLEGIVVGAGAGLGFAIATRIMPDGSVAPRGTRLHATLLTALCCGLAGLGLALAGRPLASGTINAIAVAADGSRATLAPLARLIGEPDFGPVSSAILAFGEAAMFGAGLTLGLLRRRSARDAQSTSI